MSPLNVILTPLITIALLPIKKLNRSCFYFLVCLLGATNFSILLLNASNFKIQDFGHGFIFFVDKYSCFFAMIVNLAWVITTIYSFSFIKHEFQKQAYKFHFYLSIVLATVLATAFAGNLYMLFLFYTLSIPFIYPLIVMRGTQGCKEAGAMYLRSTLLPAFFLFLPAILLIHYSFGFSNFTDGVHLEFGAKPILSSVILFMFILGMSKNCVIPFNNWLPKTMLAPAPVTALVHSIAAVKSGSIALIKIAVYVYGLEFLHYLTSKFFLAGSLTLLCGVTALYAAYQAFKTDNLKVRLSHSTVSQLSYIITAILISTPAAILGGVLHILTHSVAKITLFFIAGYYNCVHGTLSVTQIRKISPSTKWLVFCFGFCGLSIAGFPLLAGYFSKDLMLIEELHTGNYAAALFLLAGSVINIFYIAPLVKASFWDKADDSIEKKPVPLGMKLAIGAGVVTLLLLSFYTYYIVRFFEK